jgi:ribokinase
MVGCVGNDAFAETAIAALRLGGVDVSGVSAQDAPTGCAGVVVDCNGANQIAVAGGANLKARAAMLPALDARSILIAQMELPAPEIAAALRAAKLAGARVILNLAPALPLDPRAMDAVDILVVNESEAEILADRLEIRAPSAVLLARKLGRSVIVTQGDQGSEACDGARRIRVRALEVSASDTVGAGDAYVGVLAAALDRGLDLPVAMHRASVAGALACTIAGAQPAMPLGQSIEKRLGDLPLPVVSAA